MGGHDLGEGREWWADKVGRMGATVGSTVHVKEMKKGREMVKGSETMVEERGLK